MDYEKDIKIDQESLDLEWFDQPALFMRYAQHSAQASRNLDQEKQNLDVCRAEVDRDVRDDPEKFDITGKVTEGAITSAILTSDKYKDAFKKWLDAKYEADMAKGAVNAFNQRKEALENLVKLHGQSYFAGPKVPRNLGEEREKRDKAVETRMGERLTRRNR